MARIKTNELRCRVTTHLAGGARPGDIVIVDPSDPWMKSKISHERGPLVPLDPDWRPAVEEEPAQDASPEPPDGPGAAADAAGDVSSLPTDR